MHLVFPIKVLYMFKVTEWVTDLELSHAKLYIKDAGPALWTNGCRTYIKRSEGTLDALCMSYVGLIYVLCPEVAFRFASHLSWSFL